MIKRVLTIAGSDSGGGAGIQEDLKTITVLGCYGMSAITALTAQNTIGVHGVHEVPVSFIEKQIDAVISDIGVDAVKTGMLSSPEIVKAVASKIKQYSIKCLVVDPVMVSKSGDALLAENARETLKKELMPLAYLITPNLAEASILTGIDVSTPDKMHEAASALQSMGASNVLIKGGHLEGEAMDLLYNGMTYREFRGPRISTPNTHGTGCTYSAAIASFLAKGLDVAEAVAEGKLFMTRAIRHSLSLGSGHGPTNPYSWIATRAERYEVITELNKAYEILKRSRVGHLIPEVQTNLGYALSCPEGVADVAAWPGRIVRYEDTISAVGYPSFGASKHVAKIILTAMNFNPGFRSAANILFSDKVIEACREAGLIISSFDRSLEPDDVKTIEGSTLSWGVQQCLSKEKAFPDIIFDLGDVGKEPMVRVLGCDPVDVAHKILRISDHMTKRS